MTRIEFGSCPMCGEDEPYATAVINGVDRWTVCEYKLPHFHVECRRCRYKWEAERDGTRRY